MKLIEYIQKHKNQKGRAWSSPAQKKAMSVMPAKTSEIIDHLQKNPNATKCMLWRLKQRGLVEHSDWNRWHEATWTRIEPTG